jgi:hypothetical protein
VSEVDDSIAWPEGMGDLRRYFYEGDSEPYVGLPVDVMRKLLNLAAAGIGVRLALNDRERPPMERVAGMVEACELHVAATHELHQAVMAGTA